MRSRYGSILRICLGISAALVIPCAPALSQTYNIHFRSASLSAPLGGTAVVPVGLTNQPEAVTAFSFGVKHDATKLTIQKVELAPELLSLLPGGAPDARFFSANIAPKGGTGFTVALILGADSATGAAIPAGVDHLILNATYAVATPTAGTTKLDITGDLGLPKVPILLDRKGVAQAPVGTPAPVVSATVTITAGPPPFIRGDVNQSGRIDVTDAILILDYLFSGAQLPAGEATRTNCLIVMNVDGSTISATLDTEDPSDIDLTDPIFLLNGLFSATAPLPPAPFPKCGRPAAGVAVAAAMECKAFTCK